MLSFLEPGFRNSHSIVPSISLSPAMLLLQVAEPSRDKPSYVNVVAF